MVDMSRNQLDFHKYFSFYSVFCQSVTQTKITYIQDRICVQFYFISGLFVFVVLPLKVSLEQKEARKQEREQGTDSQVTFAANYVKRFSRANFSIASPSWFPSSLSPSPSRNPFSSQSLSLCARASLGISKMWAHVSRLERLLVVSATKCIENYFFCLLKLFFELY